MDLTIVVPLLNEAANVPRLLGELNFAPEDSVEVVFVDGGSHDASVALLRAAGANLVIAPRGRASQMNAGAATARGRVLLFLHADTTLPPGAAPSVQQALANGSDLWGRFDVRITGRSFLLRVVAFTMNLRSRITGIATGDQAIFATKLAFDAVGGFPDQPLMEDVELSRRLSSLSRPVSLRDKVTTSGRRWEARGVLRTIVLMWKLRFAYWRGADPRVLVREYQ